MKLNMTTAPEVIALPDAYYLYLEKRGDFKTYAPLAWQEFRALARNHFPEDAMEGLAGLSRIDETQQGDAAYIYQAGVILRGQPEQLHGLSLRTIPAGNYARFLLTGSYAQLPQAYPAAFAAMEKAGLKIRPEFCMEKYLNTPVDTEEAELKTEILIPVP